MKSPSRSPRALRHLTLALATLGLSAVAWFAGPAATAQDRLSLLSAWLSFLLLVAALLIGPVLALRTGRLVLNHLVRRDLGIWAALSGLLHTAVATGVVMTPAYFRTYISGPADAPTPGWAGWLGTFAIIAGYAVALMLMRLLSLSSNRALQRLGKERWKRAQRRAYVVFALTAAHGVIFQLIEGRPGLWILTLLAASIGVLVVQRSGRAAVSAAPEH